MPPYASSHVGTGFLALASPYCHTYKHSNTSTVQYRYWRKRPNPGARHRAKGSCHLRSCPKGLKGQQQNHILAMIMMHQHDKLLGCLYVWEPLVRVEKASGAV